jgi:hypothetical protein
MFAGKVGSFNGKRQLSHPDYQLIPDGDDVDSALAAFAGKYLPVYPAGGKMPSWKISQCVELVLDSLDEVEDYLPESVISEFGYPTLKGAFNSIHKPESLEAADLARLRLTFDEAILLQLLLAGRRAELKELDALPPLLLDPDPDPSSKVPSPPPIPPAPWCSSSPSSKAPRAPFPLRTARVARITAIFTAAQGARPEARP